jgi:hypothetical protein
VGRVDAKTAGGELQRNRCRRCPTQLGIHPQLQLTQRERFGQIVVRPTLEARDSIVHAVERGQHDNRHVREHSYEAAHLIAIESGKHVIEDHEIRDPRPNRGEGTLAVRILDDLASCGTKMIGDDRTHGGVIFDDHDPRASMHIFERRREP